VAGDAERGRETGLRDRFYDLHVNVPMQKIVTDRLRPPGQHDPYGVEQATALLETAYGMIETDMGGKTWAMGDAFTMADCAAGPAMYYANLVVPIGERWPQAAAYLGRLVRRPSFARAIGEAAPYRARFPSERARPRSGRRGA